MPALFAGKTASDEVRVWVPACATGEEAYSIAMLLAEHARTLDAPPAVQVFATDLDERRDPRRARRRLPGGDRRRRVRGAAAPLLHQEHRGYRVRRELREAVLFAAHDLLKDAPFSRLDLVSCRNLLIYLNRERAAARVRDRPLRPAPAAAGSSSASPRRSTIGAHLFQPVDKKHRIYEPRLVRARRLPVPSAATASLARALERAGSAARGGGGTAGRADGLAAASRPSPDDARRRLVARAAPEADRALRAAVDHRRPPTTRSCTSRERAGRFLQLLRRRAEQQPAARGPSGAARRPAHGAAARPRRATSAVEIGADPGRQRRRHGRRFASAVAPGRRHRARLSARHLRSPRRRRRRAAPRRRRHPTATPTCAACSSRSTS